MGGVLGLDTCISGPVTLKSERKRDNERGGGRENVINTTIIDLKPPTTYAPITQPLCLSIQAQLFLNSECLNRSVLDVIDLEHFQIFVT